MTEPTAAELDRFVAVPVEHHELERPWGRQHVVTAGPDGAPAVVLVHGWPQHWLAWRHVIGALAATNRVVAIDLRGFGWSHDPDPDLDPDPDGVSIAALATDITGAMDDLGIATAGLVAHDWGGWIGFRAALDAPGRFRHYSALAIVPPWLSWRAMARHVTGWAYVVPMAVAGQRIARRGAAVRWMVGHSTTVPIWQRPDDAAALRSYVARVADPASAAMTRRLYATLVARELPAAWGRRPAPLAVPTTVLVGEHETIARPQLYWNRTRPGELRVVTVPGARHWLAEEQPAAVIEHLRRVSA